MLTTWKEQIVKSAKRSRVNPSELVVQYAAARRKLSSQLRKMGLEDTYQAKQAAERKLRDSYYAKWLSATYPVVDLSFTKATIELIVNRTESGVAIVGVRDREPVEPNERGVTVKKYAVQDSRNGRDILSQLPDARCELGKVYFGTFQRNREKFREFSGNVNCDRPEGMPQVILTRLRDVAATAIEAHAAAVRSGVGGGRAELSRVILWEPMVKDMYVTERIPVRDDPAMLVRSGEHVHLIGFWDSPSESPIEGVLREFSDGAFDNIKVSQ